MATGLVQYRLQLIPHGVNADIEVCGRVPQPYASGEGGKQVLLGGSQIEEFGHVSTWVMRQGQRIDSVDS
jgi:hypothetical protein